MGGYPKSRDTFWGAPIMRITALWVNVGVPYLGTERDSGCNLNELLSKLLVSPLTTPIAVPYIIPHITPFKEFRL